MKSLAIASASLLTLSLSACVSQGHPAPAQDVDGDKTEDYRISVEIPLEELQISEADILKVNELLDERTSFNAEDFQLDEVVLIARSNDETGANAELLVLEWRSGQVAIPLGGEEDWFEVRVLAPAEDNGGAWLLDITGAATVNLLVAVLEPRPRVVEKIAKTTTVHQTHTVYRDRVVYPRTYHSYWIYEPSRYYTVHYHGIWPYRYFIGPWDYRHYDLAFRPYRYHHGPIYRPRSHGRPNYRHRHGVQRDRNAGVRSGDTTGIRRISPELVQLRRNHPHLRSLRQRQEPRRADGGNARHREAKRTHPRLRTFRNPERRRQSPSSVAAPRSIVEKRRPRIGAIPATPRQPSVSRQHTAPEQRNAARPSDVPGRTLKRVDRRPTATPRAPIARRAPPTRSTAPLRNAAPSRSNPGTRSFERPPRPRSAPTRTAPHSPSISPQQPSAAPVRHRNSAPRRTAEKRQPRVGHDQPATPRQLGVARQHAAPERHSAARPSVGHDRAPRRVDRRPTATPRAPIARRAPPARQEPARSNAHAQPRPRSRSAPTRNSERRTEPAAPRSAPSNSRRPAFERR